ncbi:MAG: membrane protein insertase YidC [Acidobacteriia bacterium]|nr:membrane protein insertase YidC [Terriglobia bacterium]
MGDDNSKRVVLAFALSFVVLVMWYRLFAPAPPPPPKKASPPAPAPAAPAKPEAAAPTPATPVTLPVQQGSEAEEIVIEGEFSRVTLSTQGGVIKSWVLKRYRDEKQAPLDVVNGAACQTLGFPMSLTLADAELTKKLNTGLFVATSAGSKLAAPAKVDLTYSDGKIQVRKRFSFGPKYEVHAEISVFDGLRYLPVEVAWPGGFGDHSLRAAMKESFSHLIYGATEKDENLAQAKVKEDRLIPGPFQLAGMGDRYFVSMFLPDSPDQISFRIGRRAWDPPDWKEKEKPKEAFAALASQQPRPLAFRLFVGPKDLDVLRAMNPPLDRLVDYGWFSIVAKPLFLGLRYLHDRWTHNYGWAIVILTVLINLAMFPLKLKSIRSAQEMQRIAPLVKSIQEKYKGYKFNDPRKQRMNQEVMKLYQEHHINPLGGCLPMVVQLPFLYGFYKVLDLSIELRHAPWFAWIKDLSAPDHLYILPTLMIITTFIMQKMTPMTTADPAQQRMMMIMPLVFGIMFYSFASGLVLYWLTGTVVGIAQQMFINRMIPLQPPVPAPHKTARAKE